MKFIDMFCGMGTVRMGFEQAGHECVYSIEWDKHKKRIYGVIFGNEPESSDIRSVRADELPLADCWTFGAPCQDFSIAGTRSGLEGDRSSLVREVFRLVRETKEEHRPEWLLYENVKGMLSSNKGLDYLEILFEMGELGYDIEWQLLNSKNFGVPQNRERVFTVGHLRGRSTRKVFPLVGKGNEYSTVGKSTETAIARTFTAGAHSGGNHSGMTVLQIGNVMPTATRDNPNQGRVYDPDGLALCLNKMEGGGREPYILDQAYVDGISKEYSFAKKKCQEILDEKGVLPQMFNPYNKQAVTDVAPTLTSSCDRSCSSATVLMKQNNRRIRRLTPKECMRLQGVHDYITDKLIESGISDTQLYRAAGDACTVNVIYEIALRMEVSCCT